MKFSIHHVDHSEGYTALFAINTPCVDDSGVAHAIEHLVFRGQGDFKDPNSIFQLTGLLPLKINATTTQHTTYFHCHSPIKELCLLGVEFLYQGLTRLKVMDNDLLYEVSNTNGGVIHQELAALDREISFGQGSFSLQQLLQTDDSEHRLALIGGSRAGIAALTADDLTQYYQQHYQKCSHQLWCSGQDKRFLEQVADIVNISQTSTQRVTDYQPKELNKLSPIETNNPPTLLVIEHCWWLRTSVLSLFELHRDIKARFESSMMYIVELPDYPNNSGQWPIRVLATDNANEQLSALDCYLSSYLARSLNTNDDSKGTNLLSKYRQPIRQFIERHQAAQKENYDLLAPVLSKSKRILSFISSSTVNANINVQLAPEPYEDRLLPQLSCLTYDFGSALLPSDQWIPRCDPSEHHVVYHCSPMLAAKLVKSHLDDMETRLSCCVTGQSLYIKQQDFSVQQVNHLVIAAAKRCLGHSPVLPKALIPLVDVVGDILITTADDIKASFHLGYSEEKNLDKVLSYSDQNHAIISLAIERQSLAIAAVVAVVLNSSKSLTNHRLTGRCYAVGATYCDIQQRLLIFSAFDVSPSEFVTSSDQRLNKLAQTPNYISDALVLAKHQLRYDENLVNIDQQDIELVDCQQIQQLLQTLSNHIRQSISSCDQDEPQQ